VAVRLRAAAWGWCRTAAVRLALHLLPPAALAGGVRAAGAAPGIVLRLALAGCLVPAGWATARGELPAFLVECSPAGGGP